MPSADIAGVMSGSEIATGRVELARFSERLKSRRPTKSDLPSLLVLTDDQRAYDWIEGIEALPRGAGAIVRHRDPVQRKELAFQIAKRCGGRGIKLLISGDIALALRVGADGVHFAERDACRSISLKQLRPHWLVTVAAHGLRSLRGAQSLPVDGVLLSAAFDTLSHPDRRAIGISKYAAMARHGVNVVALGGVSASTVPRLVPVPLSGIATIGGWFRAKN